MINQEKMLVTLNQKQILFIVLLVLNVLIVGPGSWILKTTWNDLQQFQKETIKKIDDLEDELSSIKINYLEKQSFSNYKQQMSENIRYLDSKLSNHNE